MHETDSPIPALSMEEVVGRISSGQELTLITLLQVRDLLTALVMASNPDLGEKIEGLHEQGKLWNDTLPFLDSIPNS